MTEQNSTADANDQEVYPFSYDHGRLPFFMKVVWLLFLAFGAWFVVTHLLDALDADLAG